MKKINTLLLFFFLSFTTFVYTQNQAHTDLPIDSRLYEAFDGNYLENLSTDNPFLLHRWNFYLDNSWYITTLPPEKSLAEYHSIRIDDLENINIFLLERKANIKRDWKKQTVLRIENTDKALVFLSGQEFTSRLNEHLGRGSAP